MKRFAAPWDTSLWLSTAALCIGLSCIAVTPLILAWVGDSPASLFRQLSFTLLIPPLVMALAWAFAPKGFTLASTELVVERPVAKVRIAYAHIRAVSRQALGLSGALRTGGNSGLFGYYGHYWSTSFGAFRMYATRWHDLVRVETLTVTYLLSPDDPAAFIEALRVHVPHAGRHAAVSETSFAPRGGVPRFVLAVLLGIPLLVGGIFGALTAFAPTGVELTEGCVRITRRWAQPIELPLSTIEGATDLDASKNERWTRRGGTAMGAVRYGRFSSDALGAFELYAWRPGPYVLLDTKQGPIVVSTDDGQLAQKITARLQR